MPDKVDLTTVNFTELVGEIKRRNTFPSQLFTLDEIKVDKVLKPLLEENETLKGQVKTKDEEIKQLKTSHEQLDKQAKQSTAKQRFNELITNGDIKLTDEQKEYVNRRFKENRLTDFSDDGLKGYRDLLLEDYKDDAAFRAKGSGTGVPGGGGQGGTNNDKTDLTKAANNELLSEDVSLE